MPNIMVTEEQLEAGVSFLKAAKLYALASAKKKTIDEDTLGFFRAVLASYGAMKATQQEREDGQ